MAVLAWGKKVSAPFARKVIELSGELQCDPSHLMAAMAFETGETFSPSVINRVSGATGLIQFMPATARSMGTTTESLATLTAEEQLDYVARYFAPYSGRLRSLADVYMVILWPKAVGKPDSYVLFKGASKAYAQNRGLDIDRDQQVTKAEAAKKVRDKLARGMRPECCLDLGAVEELGASEEVPDAIPLPRDRPPSEGDELRAAEPSDYTIEYVQRRLRELNYFTVGRPDGDYGSFVRGAIVRFKHDKGLHPEDASITPAFLALLRDPDCAPAPVSDARANATVEELQDQNPTLWALAWQKIVALVTMVGTAFMAAFNWLYEKIGTDWFLVERVGGVVAKMPVWGWLGLASGICLVGFALVKRGEHDQVQKYQRGELL